MMDYYNRGIPDDACREQRPRSCRGMYMQTEEIDRERAVSGWNPYAGEEEVGTLQEAMQQNRENVWPEQRMMRGGEAQMERTMRDRERMPEMMAGGRERMPEMMAGGRERMPEAMRRPYFQMPDFTQVLNEEQEFEQDLQRMQPMYPEAARILIPHIEDACDRMEYEGSPMYAEHIDRETVLRICVSITLQVQNQFPPMEQPEPDEVLSMQQRGDRRRPGQNWLEDLARTMLLQEMHRRRCRHGRCRRRYR